MSVLFQTRIRRRRATRSGIRSSDARGGPPSLRRNFVWTLAGNLVYGFCQWGMLVALARLGTPEMLGQFALGLAITAPVMMFANLQLRLVLATDSTDQRKFGHYLALRLMTTGLALLAIAAIACLATSHPETRWVILIIGVAKALENISDLFLGLFQRCEQMHRFALSLLIKGPLSLLALTVTLYGTGDIVLGTAAFAAVWGAVLLTYDIRITAQLAATEPTATSAGPGSLRPCWQRSALTALAWQALPLGIVTMLISLNANIPRYFVEAHAGVPALGIFASLASFVLVGSIAVNALGQAAGPRLARYFADGDTSACRSLLLRLLAVAAGLGGMGVALAALAGRPLLAACYGRVYAEAADDFVLIMAAAVPAYLNSVLGYAVTAARRFAIQAPLYAAGSIITVAGCSTLVPRLGIRGAAIAMAMASLFLAAAAGMLITATLRHGSAGTQGATRL